MTVLMTMTMLMCGVSIGRCVDDCVDDPIFLMSALKHDFWAKVEWNAKAQKLPRGRQTKSQQYSKTTNKNNKSKFMYDNNIEFNFGGQTRRYYIVDTSSLTSFFPSKYRTTSH